jgi:L-ribulose-5-phosphate 3-epimerase
MPRPNRREFLQASAIATVGHRLFAAGSTPPAEEKMRLGLILGMGKDPDAAIAKVNSLGLPTCELAINEFPPGLETRLVQALDKYHVQCTAIFTMGPGEMIWDFDNGPSTIGLVPPATRAARVQKLKDASDFAKRCGIAAVRSHCGFIPMNPKDPLYKGTVDALREVVSHCRANGQTFLYETGQETPLTLLRTILDVGLDNQGVGLDTMNYLGYGTANPVDALDVIGTYVRGIHAKDGLYPTNPKEYGQQVPIGQGLVNFAMFFYRLKSEFHYHGPVTIERETQGPNQLEDVRRSVPYLQNLI